MAELSSTERLQMLLEYNKRNEGVVELLKAFCREMEQADPGVKYGNKFVLAMLERALAEISKCDAIISAYKNAREVDRARIYSLEQAQADKKIKK